jgi:hypothetical protein
MRVHSTAVFVKFYSQYVPQTVLEYWTLLFNTGHLATSFRWLPQSDYYEFSVAVDNKLFFVGYKTTGVWAYDGEEEVGS